MTHIPNRISLDELRRMAVGDIAALPADQLVLLQDEAEEALRHAREACEWLDGAIAIKYSDRAQAERRFAGKDIRTNDRDRRGRCRNGDLVDITVREWLAGSSTFRHMHKLLRRPADFPARSAPAIDPWLLGVLIGDGTLGHGVSVTTPDAEIADALHAAAADWGLTVRVEQIQGNEANTYHLVGRKGAANPLTEALRALGLAGRGAAAKFIPDCCRLGSRDVRLAILAGLLDTDGHLCRGTGFEFSSRSLQLAGDLAFVARSLGLLATMSEKEVAGKLYWRVHISGDCERIPTRVVRKQSLPRRQKKNQLRTGFTVHPAGEGDYVGFSVDGDRRYLMGDFTVSRRLRQPCCWRC